MSEPFVELHADVDPEVTEIESLCFNCYKTGTTRLLLVRIAFFKEVVVSSFHCDHCGFENRSLEPAARIQDYGIRITLDVQGTGDLNRRVVRPAHSSIHIPDLEASFPTSDGDLSTVEGIMLKIIENIELLQPERKSTQPELASKLDTFIGKLKNLMTMEKSFALVLDDPSGNGCIEGLVANDPQLVIATYRRTAEQNAALGLAVDDSTQEEAIPECEEPNEEDKSEVVGKDEVLSFKVQCPSCNAPSETNMKLVDIPHFKQVVIMATVCSACGHRDSEVKSGGGVSPKGRLYRLKITHPSDLSRDVLVSETAAVRVPELDLESMGGTLGGRFTTLEGLFLAIKDQLVGANPFLTGDSCTEDEKRGKLSRTIEELQKVADGKHLNILFELRDPAGNSYLQNLYAPEPDPQMEVTDYDRTDEENDELGLKDMKVDDAERS
ncbi:Zinc finger protein ZPR1 [Fasciolopsis buskii]|uniref:Zinc finger protein ZPR1 n=1 Tax=Fasciolopsis buskii TaxID=27845 RepID=A0A8E0RM81_9TREM|nr:Zinc finger protein ZPR1 [Fasciolopsis buski]